MDDRMQKLVELLSPLQSLKRHQDVRSQRLDNTGDWLLQHDRFCLWRDGGSNMGSGTLFCYGIPGAGKTILRYLIYLILILVHFTRALLYWAPYINTDRLDIVQV